MITLKKLTYKSVGASGVTSSTSDQSVQVLLEWPPGQSGGQVSPNRRYRYGREFLEPDNDAVYVFVLNKKINIEGSTMPYSIFRNSEMVPLGTYYIGNTSYSNYIKVLDARTDTKELGELGTQLVLWAHSLNVNDYLKLRDLQNKNSLTICAFSNKNNYVVCTDDIIGLKRTNKRIGIDGDATYSVTKTLLNSYADGFFIDAGYYRNKNLYIDANSYILYDKVSGKSAYGEPMSANQVINLLSDSYNYSIALLMDSEESDSIHYQDVTELFPVPEDDYDYSSWGSGGSGTSANEAAKAPVHLPNLQGSTLNLTYVNGYNNYNLVFVPCKDSRTTVQDAFKNNTKLKLQSYSSKIQNKDGIKYYKTSDMAIYAVLPEDKVPSDATTSLGPENFIQIPSVESNSSVFLKYLDSFFHFNRNFESSYIWSSDGKRFPGTGKNLEKNYISNSDGYIYCNNRIPKMCCLIVKKDNTQIDSILSNTESNIQKESFKVIVGNSITFSSYFDKTVDEKSKYRFLYFDLQLEKNNELEDNRITIKKSSNNNFSTFITAINPTIRNCDMKDFSISYSVKQERGKINLYKFELFEAYTRGHDFIQDDYTTVRPAEYDSNKNKLMDFDDNYFTYKYTGREIDLFQNKDKANCFKINGAYCALIHEKDLLLETDVTLGDTYGYQKYFIEAIKYPELSSKNTKTGNYLYKDTFKVKDFLEAVDKTKYVDEDLKILTGEIDLLQCKYYDATKASAENGWCDCCSKDGKTFNRECLYQKMGICPYRFQTEKHPRRIRTLEQNKSNRFNLIQELSKVFEFYPQFYIEYDDNGKVKLDKSGRPMKFVYFMTEKGAVNYNGFRYEKNLSGISRDIDSSSFTTKMYVESVDSELMDSGLCSIATATDNIGRNSYVLDFSYYTKKGLLDPEQTQRDIYGIEKNDMAFLPTIGDYNKKYDSYSNLINTLTGEQMTTLEAEIQVAVTGITTALEERKKVSQTMYQFKMRQTSLSQTLSRQTSAVIVSSYKDYTTSDTYISYMQKFREQAAILWGLVEQLFFKDDYFTLYTTETTYRIINLSDPSTYQSSSDLIYKYKDKYCKGELFWRLTLEGFEDDNYKPPFKNWNDFKTKIVDTYSYPTNGQLGQYRGMLEQVKYWKTEREKILNKINDISDKFYRIYEPYIKEGTWTDSNYLTDNEYYWAAIDVLNDSCKPKVNYNFSVVDISPIEIYSDDYTYDLGDTTYVEDIDFFDINKKTGLPNRQKVIISEIVEKLDEPKPDEIKIQNYTTQFDDLFESISASVQSLTFNENTYRRAANFTSQQYIQQDSLQGTLDQGDLTIIDANSNNIVLDDSGTQGNGISNQASQYKLTGEGLYFSTDGGTTWDVGVGPQGTNADYIKYGQLDASKVQIVDGQYIYFLWDKNGINAYRNPATSTNGLVDFARFNKYGLSLIENNHVRLRAGYEFKTNEGNENITGNYQSELPLTNQDVGFYLYNDTGKPIFKTETQSEYGEKTGEDYSARLSLKGEIFATNKNLSSGDNFSSGKSLTSVMGRRLRNGYQIEAMQVPALYSSSRAEIFLNGNGKYLAKTNDGSVTPGSWFFLDINDTKNKGGDSISVEGEIVQAEGGDEKVMYSFFVTRNTNITSAAPKEDYYMKESDTKLYSGKVDSKIYTFELYQVTLMRDKKTDDETPSTISFTSSNFNIDTLKDKYEWTNNGDSEKYQMALDHSVYSDEYATHSNGKYRIYRQTVNVATAVNYAANVVIANQSLTPQQVSFYIQKDINSSGAARTTLQLYSYKASYDGTFYSYWTVMEQTNVQIDQNSSNVVTNEVGIFINNKISLDESEDDYIPVEGQAAALPSENGNPFTDNSGDFYFLGDSYAAQLASDTDFGSFYIGQQDAKIGDNNLYSARIEDIRKAKSIAICLGLDNDDYKKYNSNNNLAETYKKTVDYIVNSSESIETIYICSLLGVSKNNDIETFNEKLKSAAESIGNGKKVVYVDLYSKTKDYAAADSHSYNISKVADSIYNAFAKATNNSDTVITPGTAQQSRMDAAIRNSIRGGERVFTIAIAGVDNNNRDVYRNILSVLKTGALYIGGVIKNQYGQELSLDELGQLPDKIKIEEPGIIMDTSGNMFCNWDKFYYMEKGQASADSATLKNILDMITTGSGAGSTYAPSAPDSGTGPSQPSNLTSGYYFVDPMNYGE